MKTNLQVGDVVQIDPASDPMFGGAFLTVTEPKPWGAQGFVHHLVEGGARAYYRVKTENLHYIGHAEWMPKDDAT